MRDNYVASLFWLTRLRRRVLGGHTAFRLRYRTVHCASVCYPLSHGIVQIGDCLSLRPSAMQPGRSGAIARKPQPSSSERAKISTGYSCASAVRVQPAKAISAIAPVITPTTKLIAAIKIVVILSSELARLCRVNRQNGLTVVPCLHTVIEPSTRKATAHNKTSPATGAAIWEPPQHVTIGGCWSN